MSAAQLDLRLQARSAAQLHDHGIDFFRHSKDAPPLVRQQELALTFAKLTCGVTRFMHGDSFELATTPAQRACGSSAAQ
jgi:hypothetical protein